MKRVRTKTREELREFWDEERNGFPVSEVTDNSKLYWWKHKSEHCDCVHRVQLSTSKMLSIKGTNCPQCDCDPSIQPCCIGRSVMSNSKLFPIFDEVKNRKSSRDVFLQGNTSDLYYWKCYNTCQGQADCKHEWTQTIRWQSKAKLCPYCTPQTVKLPCCTARSVAGHPELMRFWDKPENDAKEIFARDLHCSSQTDIHLVCPNHCDSPNCQHKWTSTVGNYYYKETGCPFCAVPSRRVCCPLRSAAANPMLLNSFDADHSENKNIRLDKMSAGAHVDVWWKCTNTCPGQPDCRHIWKSTLESRTKGSKCAHCASKSEIPCCISRSAGNEQYAEMMKDFDTKKNYPLTPRDYFPYSQKLVHWKCQFCSHLFDRQMYVRVSARSVGCPFCTNGDLCGDKSCDLCLIRSLAAWNDEEKKQAFILGNNNVELHTIGLTWQRVFQFYCKDCKHTINQRVCSVVTYGDWCMICTRQHSCGDSDCTFCGQACQVRTRCGERTYPRTAKTSLLVGSAVVWACGICKQDWKERSPNVPLLSRSSNSIETLTLQQICLAAQKQDRDQNTCLASVWSNPSAWDCAVLPGLDFKPDNIWCFDERNAIFTTVGACKINLHAVKYAFIFEILECGIVQHSETRTISDVKREMEIRAKFNDMDIPVGFVYLVVAHNMHKGANPRDVFCFKNHQNAYDILPSRSSEWHELMSRVLATFTRFLETKCTDTYIVS